MTEREGGGNQVLVPNNTVHMVTNCPRFGTRGSLTFDFSIASYKDNIANFFSLFYYTGYTCGT